MTNTSTGRPTAAHVATKKFTAADLLLAASTAQGIHLTYKGVTTLPELPTHDNDIPIQSFSFGTSRSILLSGGVQTVGKPNVSQINLSHVTDNYSLPLLRQSLVGAAPGVSATLYFTDLSGAGGTPFDFLQIDLGQTLISSFQMSSGGTAPDESISLSFVTMKFTYRIAGTTTVQTVSYNLATGS